MQTQQNYHSVTTWKYFTLQVHLKKKRGGVLVMKNKNTKILGSLLK